MHVDANAWHLNIMQTVLRSQVVGVVCENLMTWASRAFSYDLFIQKIELQRGKDRYSMGVKL